MLNYTKLECTAVDKLIHYTLKQQMLVTSGSAKLMIISNSSGFLVINYSFTVYTLPPNRPLKASPSPNTYQNNLSVHFNPLKPSVIIWLHFECSVPHRPNLPFLPSEHLCYGSLGSCNSVCLSVCHMHALWQNQIMHCGYFDTTRKGNHSSFLTPTVVGGRCPLPSEICAQSDQPSFRKCRLWQISAYNISTIRHNKKFNYDE